MVGTDWEKRQKKALKASKLIKELIGYNDSLFIPGFYIKQACKCRFYNKDYWCNDCKGEEEIFTIE